MPAGRTDSGPPPLEIRKFTTQATALQAIHLLENRITEVKDLEREKIRYNDERVYAAERQIRGTVLDVFGENSQEYRDHQYHRISGGLRFPPGGANDSHIFEANSQQDFVEGIPRTITMLKALVRTIDERTVATQPAAANVAEVRALEISNKVFVVHGRNEGVRETVARFVGQLKLEPVILHEQASEGRTLIEKFERHADVGFAVVLFTADDRGGPIEEDPASYLPRARQNVVLELGYFCGALRRSRVCVLYQEGVELPSDFHGVVYVPLDAGGAWKLKLAKEMKTAGLSVDMNLAI